jgi:hypothetical protein
MKPLMPEIAHTKEENGGEPRDGTGADDAAARCPCGAALGQRLLHEKVRQRCDKRVIAAEIFRAFRRRRREADEPLPALGRRQREADRVRQPHGGFAAHLQPVHVFTLLSRDGRLSRCKASSTKLRTAAGSRDEDRAVDALSIAATVSSPVT